MTRQASSQIKSAPGQCKLRVIDTDTRDAIVADVNGPNNTTTIAYVAIGAEAWGPLLAAAPDLAEALRSVGQLLDTWPAGIQPSAVSVKMAQDIIVAALAKASL